MELIEEADWPIVAKRYKLPDRSRLGDRPSRSATLSKTASRSGASARRGSMEVSPLPCPLITDFLAPDADRTLTVANVPLIVH